MSLRHVPLVQFIFVTHDHGFSMSWMKMSVAEKRRWSEVRGHGSPTPALGVPPCQGPRPGVKLSTLLQSTLHN